MSDEKGFLSRWSRRKQEAARDRERSRATLDRRDADDAAAKGPPATAEPFIPPGPSEPQEPETDLSSLPPIESIDAKTDMAAFLRQGVPADLTRAALRRAWTEDPAIRDFIEVAENQWDFATGSDIPGFGPLEPSDGVRRMVAEIVDHAGAGGRATQGPSTDAAPPDISPEEAEPRPAVAQRPEAGAAEAVPPRDDGAEAAQDCADRDQHNVPPLARRHGSALPQ